eukprot:1099854-Amphidinium_carterae.1
MPPSCFWKTDATKENIMKLEDAEEQRKAKTARKFLCNRQGCSYKTYDDKQKAFVLNHPAADERQCRRRLQLIEEEAIESGVWPWLFFDHVMMMRCASVNDNQCHSQQ